MRELWVKYRKFKLNFDLIITAATELNKCAHATDMTCVSNMQYFQRKKELGAGTVLDQSVYAIRASQ